MALVIIRNDDKGPEWKAALEKIAPDLDIYVYPEAHPLDEVRMAAVWKQPEGSLESYRNLLGIHSMGAGVDFILGESKLEEGLPLLRVVDPRLTADMAEYVLTHCLAHIRGLQSYRALQQESIWRPTAYRRATDTTVGIMGLGELGMAAAKVLLQNGFQCRAWTRKSTPEVDFPCFTGKSERNAFLSACDILVCLLPLTPETRAVLGQAVFDELPEGAFLINAARGGHLDENALLESLDSGRLSGACLDVFQQEPLPKGHPFWTHPGIRITPHVASVSDPDTVAAQLIANYRALIGGNKPANLVDLERGY